MDEIFRSKENIDSGPNFHITFWLLFKLMKILVKICGFKNDDLDYV